MTLITVMFYFHLRYDMLRLDSIHLPYNERDSDQRIVSSINQMINKPCQVVNQLIQNYMS